LHADLGVSQRDSIEHLDSRARAKKDRTDPVAKTPRTTPLCWQVALGMLGGCFLSAACCCHRPANWQRAARVAPRFAAAPPPRQVVWRGKQTGGSAAVARGGPPQRPPHSAVRVCVDASARYASASSWQLVREGGLRAPLLLNFPVFLVAAARVQAGHCPAWGGCECVFGPQPRAHLPRPARRVPRVCVCGSGGVCWG